LNLVEKLIESFSKLPGVGRKSASRIVYYLLKTDRAFSEVLARDILELKNRIRTCRICGNYTDIQPCSLCTDENRNRSVLCVVEEAKDILSIESTREYNGVYHVLMGVISPLDGIGPEDLRISSLIDRIKTEGVQEVILATNPTMEGDTTALYLINRLKSQASVKLTRLALGLPVGGDLEYTDRLTLARAFKGRSSV
jgi:recombination protein RecR